MSIKTRILIAPNAFKDALDAENVANAIAEGLERSKLNCETIHFPVGDGGDGTCELLCKKREGKLVFFEISNPLGEKIEAPIGLINGGKVAVIEMADASGIRLLNFKERNPLLTTSVGTGELIKHALDLQVSEILIGMGGSATVDGGCGILHALGIRFLDKNKRALSPYPRELQRMVEVDDSHLDKRLRHCKITILCDVKNPLLGEQGASRVFGSQKGATEEEIIQLENFLSIFQKIVLQKKAKDINVEYGGTAGGAAAGLSAFTQAEMVNGIDCFLKMTNFEDSLRDADYLITGEGCIDNQTSSGKAPFGVASIAKRYAIPVIGMAGEVSLNPSEDLWDSFNVLLSINNKVGSLSEILKATRQNLIHTSQNVGNLLAIGMNKSKLHSLV